ncbi:hypothetical protein CCHOA_04655 [Corynebacterium choanae]|uniref:Uncharacterized protein n=1 Tax=Corynebacterium choanae TaxID=1862358 RepID=A0A3G6J5W9_9CORY|nr:hypothetical protein CCHOA_04655 [Corynebacterium choanae]
MVVAQGLGKLAAGGCGEVPPAAVVLATVARLAWVHAIQGVKQLNFCPRLS